VYRISSSSGRDSSISSYDDEDDVEIPKTPRRVTFGGELIKIRSPDVSDEHHEIHKSTGIPIPIKPALSIPKHPKNENISIKLPLSRQVTITYTLSILLYFIFSMIIILFLIFLCIYRCSNIIFIIINDIMLILPI